MKGKSLRNDICLLVVDVKSTDDQYVYATITVVRYKCNYDSLLFWGLGFVVSMWNVSLMTI